MEVPQNTLKTITLQARRTDAAAINSVTICSQISTNRMRAYGQLYSVTL